jgi:uncharacterized protein
MARGETLILGDQTVLFEYGPVRMFIDGSMDGVRRPDLCAQAAGKAADFLKDIVTGLDAIKKPFSRMKPPEERLKRNMYEAVLAVGDEDLTPMAAVAGVMADAVADELLQMGLTKVIVNNGGDLAIRLRSAERVTIGVRPDIASQRVTHKVVVTEEMKVGGVCSSGFGGRSFTRGCASAAVILASSAALADAAATSAANATFVDSKAVERVPAQLIDPNTDLQGVDVTRSIGLLEPEEISLALSRGVRRAERLAASGLIFAAFIAVQGSFAVTDSTLFSTI